MIRYDVNELFPTTIIEIEVEENTDELKFVKNFPSTIDENNTYQGLTSKNLRVLEKYPYIRDLLLSKFNYIAENYLKYKRKKYIITTSWITKTLKGGYSHNHRHRNSFWSGVYYFQDEYEDGTAELCFSNPNEQLSDVTFEENDIKEDVIVNSNSAFFNPQPKLLLLFPSYLSHQILHHSINTERLSLAFNIMPNGQWGESDSAININWFK